MRRITSGFVCLLLAGMMLLACGAAVPEGYEGAKQDSALPLPINSVLYGSLQGSGVWYAFATTPDGPVNAYSVTVADRTADQRTFLRADIYDGDGNRLNEQVYTAAGAGVSGGGAAVTVPMPTVEQGAVYYVRLRPMNKDGDVMDWFSRVDYALTVNGPLPANTYAVTGDLMQARGAAAALGGEMTPGQSQADAGFIPLGADIAGTVSDRQNAWFGFAASASGGIYTVTFGDMTSGGCAMLDVYDRFGTQLAELTPEPGGAKVTSKLGALESGSSYYLCVHTDPEVVVGIDADQYTLRVDGPSDGNVRYGESGQPLLFQVPYELNATRLVFADGQDTFADQQTAETVLAPLADILLANPDRTVLLAGATDGFGSQEDCAALSAQRAEAVKTLLVSAFGVPQDQLLTVGMGYEKDPFAYGQDADANGDPVESEILKNRRIVVLDAEDPIAQDVLSR